MTGDKKPKTKRENQAPETETSQPAVVVVWDPEIISEDEYADFIAAVGNVVRSHGGLGVELIRRTMGD